MMNLIVFRKYNTIRYKQRVEGDKYMLLCPIVYGKISIVLTKKESYLHLTANPPYISMTRKLRQFYKGTCFRISKFR